PEPTRCRPGALGGENETGGPAPPGGGKQRPAQAGRATGATQPRQGGCWEKTPRPARRRGQSPPAPLPTPARTRPTRTARQGAWLPPRAGGPRVTGQDAAPWLP